jgi:hypothetical protein
VLASGLLGLPAGCSRESPSAPPAAVSTPRPVGIALADSVGAPLAGAQVRATSLFDVNGFAVVLAATTDLDGGATLDMLAGPWIVSARAADGRVAGSHSVILAPTSPAPDSVLVRLAARAPSRIEGHARLAGRSDHRNILVSAIGIDGALAVTDSAGAYALDHLPPGAWTVFCGALGFSDGFVTVTVPAPASTVTAPDVELISNPDEAKVHPPRSATTARGRRDFHPTSSISSRRAMASRHSVTAGTRAQRTYPAPASPRYDPGRATIPIRMSRSTKATSSPPGAANHR